PKRERGDRLQPPALALRACVSKSSGNPRIREKRVRNRRRRGTNLRRTASDGPPERTPDMANSPMNDVLRHLRRTSRRQADGGLTDGQLLERFLAARDEAAFESLLRRHGPMVLGVCRRVLGGAAGAYDAEDAFQATFLVLVHRAGAVAARESV